MGNGKKIGKFHVSTVLAEYDLDVRLDMESNEFVILVPDNPGEAVVTKSGARRTYQPFRAATLAEAKEAVKACLSFRDTTEFVDVIEYDCLGVSSHSYMEVADSVGFDFRVARVSVAKDQWDHPKLEIPVDIDDDGHITITKWGFDGSEKLCSPQAHRTSYDTAMPFTVSRWRTCRAIKDGILAIGKMLFELLGESGDAAGAKLDALPCAPLLLTGLIKTAENGGIRSGEE